MSYELATAPGTASISARKAPISSCYFVVEIKVDNMTTLKRPKRTGTRTKKARPMRTKDYKADFLMSDLTNLDRAADYLTAAIEEGEDVFLLAVRDVAEAHGGIKSLAETTRLNRENLYDMLSKKGNPRLSSIASILNNLGLEMRFTKKAQSASSPGTAK